MECTKKILVVEDERIAAEDIAQRIKSIGYRISAIFATGEDALSFIQNTQPDLVLMDVKLKGAIDGIETAKKITAKYDIPIIFLTAYSDKHTIDRIDEAGLHGYISKPVEENELRCIIDTVLHRHEIEKNLHEREAWVSTILKSIGDAVLATDHNKKIAFMNPVA